MCATWTNNKNKCMITFHESSLKLDFNFLIGFNLGNMYAQQITGIFIGFDQTTFIVDHF